MEIRQLAKQVILRSNELLLGNISLDQINAIKLPSKESSDLVVFLIIQSVPKLRPLALIKIPRFPGRANCLIREYESLAYLHRLLGATEAGSVIPGSPELINIAERQVLIEGILEGNNARWAAKGWSSLKRVVNCTLEWLLSFQQATFVVNITIGSCEWDRCVKDEINRFHVALQNLGNYSPIEGMFIRSLNSLGHQFQGKRIPLTCQHGDLSPHNLLIKNGKQLSGVLDWEDCNILGFAFLDFYDLVVCSLCQINPDKVTNPFMSYFLNWGKGMDLFRIWLQRYADGLEIEQRLLYSLFPSYLVHAVCRDIDEHRQSLESAKRWLKRLEEFFYFPPRYYQNERC